MHRDLESSRGHQLDKRSREFGRAFDSCHDYNLDLSFEGGGCVLPEPRFKGPVLIWVNHRRSMSPARVQECGGVFHAEQQLVAVQTCACESLETPRLTLRCVSEDDAVQTSLLMTEQVSRWLANWPFPFSEEMSPQRIRQMQQWAIEGRALPFAIVRKMDNRLIGWAMLVRDKPGSTRASLGYWLGEAFQGQGYMKEVAPAVIRVGFRKLNVEKIEAAAQPENLASIALMRACGMVEEGQVSVFAAARNREEICTVFAIERRQSM